MSHAEGANSARVSPNYDPEGPFIGRSNSMPCQADDLRWRSYMSYGPRAKNPGNPTASRGKQ
jgi:hypothetical protein